MAGLVPWLITHREANDWWLPLRTLGDVLIAAGLTVLLEAFARFAIEGIGTPAPVAPTERLVIGGLPAPRLTPWNPARGQRLSS